MSKKLILIELNEINFDVVRAYLGTHGGDYVALRQLLQNHGIVTTSETKYELLEPWIQWPSVHTGTTFEQHGLLRLGDVAGSSIKQFFEQLEERGHRVGAVSPMNAANRLRSPAYFIPDPWTETPSDGSIWSKRLGTAVSQAVNDNAEGKLQPSSIIWLLLGLLRFARWQNYGTYLKLALRSWRAPWRKALFLDLFLHDLHLRLFRQRSPGFSVLFLNAGAHIQHHYFLCAKPLRSSQVAANPGWYVRPDADPVAEMLAVYDRIVSDYLTMSGVATIVATGLSQVPYDRVKYYYRLKDHASFLKRLGVKFRKVVPRMTRDFLIEFDSADNAESAEHRLRSVVVNDGVPLFREIDNRGRSLFVTLTYPDEITSASSFRAPGMEPDTLLPHVVFVAIKNGMHQGRGFAYFSGDVAHLSPPEGAHVSQLHQTVMNYLEKAGQAD